MTKEKHLLFVGTLPQPGFGTCVIIYRNLKRLKGWKISIASAKHLIKKEYSTPRMWRIIELAQHRWWWPPLKPYIFALFQLRLYFWKLKCERLLNKERPSIILNQLGRDSALAYYLSKAWRVPLFMMIHDRWQVWVKTEFDKLYMTEKRAESILNHASKIWATSPGLATFYKVNNPKKISVLFAMPEGGPPCFAQWRDDFKTHPVIVSSGSFRDYQIDIFKNIAFALQRINGTLLIISNKKYYGHLKSQLEGFPNIIYNEPFVRNAELISFLKEKASCILVPGCFRDELDWKINIPERLVEFSHLGIPMIILSPPHTCLSDWAKAHKWHGHLDTLDKDKLFELVKQITDKEKWLAMAEQSKNVALNEFSSDKIQAQFESELEAILPTTSI
jgi:hypothetical protein